MHHKMTIKGLFWGGILKVSKHFLGPEMPLSTFWQDKYDVTIQSHSRLLSFLSIEKQDTFSGRSEKEANYRFPYSTNQRRASTTEELLALLHHNGMFCLDERCPTPSVNSKCGCQHREQKIIKSVIFMSTQSQECSWLPGSQSLYQLPLKMSRQNKPINSFVNTRI